MQMEKGVGRQSSHPSQSFWVLRGSRSQASLPIGLKNTPIKEFLNSRPSLNGPQIHAFSRPYCSEVFGDQEGCAGLGSFQGGCKEPGQGPHRVQAGGGLRQALVGKPRPSLPRWAWPVLPWGTGGLGPGSSGFSVLSLSRSTPTPLDTDDKACTQLSPPKYQRIRGGAHDFGVTSTRGMTAVLRPDGLSDACWLARRAVLSRIQACPRPRMLQARPTSGSIWGASRTN